MPSTGVPVEPARLRPARFEMNMKIVSVAPMPSRISTPKRSRHAWYTSAGRRSPADTQSLVDRKASAGSSARKSRA